MEVEKATAVTEDNTQITILLVEDDAIDAKAFQRGFKKSGRENPVVHVKDGIAALEILRAPAEGRAVSAPFIIVLDLNMPKMNGHEFLAELRGDENVKRAPVIVLSTSESPKDIRKAHDQHVLAYVVKSKVGDHYAKLINLIAAYEDLAEPPDVTG